MATKTKSSVITLRTELPKGEDRLVIRVKGYKVITTLYDTDPIIYKVSHPVFKAVESFFDDWFKKQPHNVKQLYDGYFEEYQGPVFDRKQAIEGGIENLLGYAREHNLKTVSSKQFYDAEVDAAFNL